MPESNSDINKRLDEMETELKPQIIALKEAFGDIVNTPGRYLIHPHELDDYCRTTIGAHACVSMIGSWATQMAQIGMIDFDKFMASLVKHLHLSALEQLKRKRPPRTRLDDDDGGQEHG